MLRHPKLHAAEQMLISEFVEREFGIKMPPSKKTLLEGRLAKRLQICGLQSYGEYFDFITKNANGRDEFLFFTDLVSTHETSFFREDKHFNFISQKVMPGFCEQSWRKEINVLSAACSSGEEAYTIAMQLSEDLERLKRTDIRVSIEGIDLSRRMVEIAQRAVYTEERISRIPASHRLKYLMQGKHDKKRLYRFVPELREMMAFHAGNLLSGSIMLKRSYDIIFCRNVLIYFNRDNQNKAVKTLISHMDPDAYLFLGHSESMNGLNLPIHAVSPAVFRKN